MKRSIVLLALLGCVVLVGCFKKSQPTDPDSIPPQPVDEQQPTETETGSTASGDVADDEVFDPANYDDPEIEEIFELFEELVAE